MIGGAHKVTDSPPDQTISVIDYRMVIPTDATNERGIVTRYVFNANYAITSIKHRRSQSQRRLDLRQPRPATSITDALNAATTFS